MKKGSIAAMAALLGATAGIFAGSKVAGKGISQKDKKVNKFKTYYCILNQWLVLKQQGKSLVSYFEENEYHRIAIYGMGEMGNRLYEELKDSSVEVTYGIDREAECVYSEIPVVNPDDELGEVDAVVVTSVFAFDEIKEELSKTIEYPIISLEEVVYEI